MRSCAIGSLVGLAVAGNAPQIPKHWGSPRFDGKKVLVTGGDSGIGLGAVEAFYFECASVMMVGHNAKKTADAAANLTSLPAPTGCKSTPVVKSLALDISNATAVKEMTATTFQQLGGLDIAVNNAGSGGSAGPDLPGSDGFEEYFSKSLEMKVNVDGTLWCMHEQLKLWKENKIPGAMVNVASVFGETVWGRTSYTASKWAEIGFTKNAALKYAPYGIRINAVAPGTVDTPMLRGGLPKEDPKWKQEKAQLEKAIPDRHVADPWEMAGVITFLASDMSHYVIGQVITADGGLTLAPPLGLGGTNVDKQEALVV